MSRFEIKAEAEYFGPLYPFIENPQITDIDYNGSELWITTVDNRRCKIDQGKNNIGTGFLEQFSQRIANEVSKGFNQNETVLEAETDRLRITFVHESVALTGRTFCIRKSLPVVRIDPQTAIESGYCSREIMAFLVNCVLAKMNFVFCGEPAAGKTECAKFLSRFIAANERVITIEDNPEWHYKEINPGKDCVELKINGTMDYTKAIKTCLRLNPNWIMLSETRSIEAKSLIECWSTGIKGFTTLHTDDVRKIPDRFLNMMGSSLDGTRLENDIYTYVDVGILVRKKGIEEGKTVRRIDQVCLYSRENGKNETVMIAEDGKMLDYVIPLQLQKRLQYEGIGNLRQCPGVF